jgi:FkbM family methyltransferase
MLFNFKKHIRNIISPEYQVPLKYWYSRFCGYLEPEMTILPKLSLRSGRVIDVGANRGVYAYALSKLCLHLDLFEPNPQCAEILRSWASCQPNIQVHGVALSDVEGVASLRVPIDSFGVEHDSSASLESCKTEQFTEHMVQSIRLDKFGFQNVALIKIDVEGHEHRVIQGAHETIAKEKPAILIEIEQRHHTRSIIEIFNQITNLDYEGYFLVNNVLHSIQEFDSFKHQLSANLGGSHGDYVNNFLFLNRRRSFAGDYDLLLN